MRACIRGESLLDRRQRDPEANPLGLGAQAFELRRERRIAPPPAEGGEHPPAGDEEIPPREGLGPGIVLQRRRVALGLVPAATVERRLDGVPVEPQVVVTHALLPMPAFGPRRARLKEV